MMAAAHIPVPQARVSPSTPRSYVRMAMWFVLRTDAKFALVPLGAKRSW